MDEGLKKLLASHMWRTKAMEDLLEYRFKDKTIALSALNLPGRLTSIKDNTGLAQVGKAVMELFLITDGYDKDMDPENIDTLLTFVLDNSKLADIGTKKGLGRCMMGMRSSTANLTPLYTARTVQALMGAVYLDSDGDLEKLYEAMMAIGLLPKPGAQLPV
ncbi:TPA_exp: putative RNAse III [Trichophyton benhamiae CBS 112371]|uniref:RNAse III, putative n=1 Tax=Arthroderma benhamiae (strain ATCC MYA-4681 / CBS 112371) TaxID=663331 RepID=D4AQ56_ARTBC|nr:RNAse III, putative [Trichophyton benhamiae CBS 112371]EFE34600.1 RNAse III, putative [Trichophyton benhamiae CBS 112371]DAA77529.1 TPA_exp: putative RNAse III [Trichophyton benhamiae CBS 112371]